jgi:hypothetical protein
MNTRTVICAIAATFAAGSLLAAASALAAAPSNGCPSGYQLLSVPTLTAEGYRVPALVDNPSSGVVGQGPGVGRGWTGQPGNGDGWVCACNWATNSPRSACRSTTSSTTSYRPDVIDRLRAWAGSRRAEHRALAEYRTAWRRLVRLRRGREHAR